MRMRRWKIVVVGAVVVWSGSVHAQFAQEGPALNRKVRNLGMGNVGVALIGTHDSSPFYNPAGLNDLEKGRFQFMSPTLDTSRGALDLLISDVGDFVNAVSDAQTDAERTRAFDQFLSEHQGDFEQARLTLDIFNYSRKNFAAGLVLDERLHLSFRDPTFPRFEMQNLADVALYVAMSHDFREKLIQVGVMIKPTVRFSLDEADQEFTYSDVVTENSNGDPILKDQVKNIKDRRFGLGVDLGLKSNVSFLKGLPGYDYLKPEVGFAWQDIGSPSFSGAPGNEQSLSTGFAVHPNFWKLKNSVAVDFRELNQDRPFFSKFHFGLEAKFPWIFALRGGVSQGYLTGGLTLDGNWVKLDAAIYSEEIGVKSTEAGSLRYAATLSFNI